MVVENDQIDLGVATEPAHHHLSSKSVWIFFARNLLRLSIVPVVFILYLVSLVPNSSNISLGAYNVLLISVIFNIAAWIIGSLLWGWLIYHSYKYQLTASAFLKERGVLSKKYIVIPYENIQNIEIVRNFFARALGLSEIRIETASRHTIIDGRLAGLTESLAIKLKDLLLKRAHEAKINLHRSDTS